MDLSTTLIIGYKHLWSWKMNIFWWSKNIFQINPMTLEWFSYCKNLEQHNENKKILQQKVLMTNKQQHDLWVEILVCYMHKLYTQMCGLKHKCHEYSTTLTFFLLKTDQQKQMHPSLWYHVINTHTFITVKSWQHRLLLQNSTISTCSLDLHNTHLP